MIKRYGLSCSIVEESNKEIGFKGILYYSKNNAINQEELMLIEPTNMTYATLIIGNMDVISKLNSCQYLKIKEKRYQILQKKEHYFKDQLFYVSLRLSPI